MRFAPGEEAMALRDAAAELLTAEVTPEIVRAGWPDGDPGRVNAVWRRLAGTGALGALVPESMGGLGLDENSMVALLEEVGSSGLPAPAAEVVAIGAPLLAAAGGERLGEVLAGWTLVAAELSGGELVPFGQRSELIMLGDTDRIRLYDRDELDLEPCPTVDGSRAMARVVRRSGGLTLTDDPGVIAQAWRRGVLGTSALLIGLARRMLEMTVRYVKQREQFGVPIGSFQAVKHSLASVLVAVEFARPVMLAAAWSQSAGVSDELTWAAKVLCSDAARLSARTAIQCHGAMGYTTEYDLHLFAKRVWALAPTWGDAASQRSRLAEILGV